MRALRAIGAVYANYATFSGRASRSEFWWFYLAGGVVFLLLSRLSDLDGGLGALFHIAQVIFTIGSTVPFLAVVSRRLHDTGHSGAYFFISFVPLVGPIVLAVWLASAPRADGARFESAVTGAGP